MRGCSSVWWRWRAPWSCCKPQGLSWSWGETAPTQAQVQCVQQAVLHSIWVLAVAGVKLVQGNAGRQLCKWVQPHVVQLSLQQDGLPAMSGGLRAGREKQGGKSGTGAVCAAACLNRLKTRPPGACGVSVLCAGPKEERTSAVADSSQSTVLQRSTRRDWACCQVAPGKCLRGSMLLVRLPMRRNASQLV